MSCCGKKREQLLTAARSRSPTPDQASSLLQASPSRVVFEYVGRTGLTVIGAVSGKQYRFARPGARLQVDPRDGISMRKVPHLRQLTAAGVGLVR
jgi:hypothetical protein